MTLRSILGMNLSGKLRMWRKRYESNVHEFDHSRVECVVSARGDGWGVAAFCYCSDPNINGFDMSQMARIYSSKRFRTRVEAEAHLEVEVRNATPHHRETVFYRHRELNHVKGGFVQDQPLSVHECYDGNKWVAVDVPSGARRCESCAFKTDDPVCPKCGGLTR